MGTTTCVVFVVVCFVLVVAYVFSFIYSSNNNDFLKYKSCNEGKFITKLSK